MEFFNKSYIISGILSIAYEVAKQSNIQIVAIVGNKWGDWKWKHIKLKLVLVSL